MNRRLLATLVLRAVAFLPALATGCVERKFVVLSDPPGAYVLVNNRPLGASTPADGYYVYNGTYEFTLIKDGYEPLVVRQPLPSRWWEIPPLDFVTENILPFDIKDERRLGPYKLQPLQMPNVDDVVNRGEKLRQEAHGLGAPPAGGPVPGPAAGPPPVPVGPAPSPNLPPPTPVPPSVTGDPPGTLLTPTIPPSGR